MKKIIPGLALLFMMLFVLQAYSQPASDADAAWKKVQQSAVLPEWTQQRSPTTEERKQFYKQSSEAAAVAATKAEAFYTQFPDSTNEVAARKLEVSMLQWAFNIGGRTTNVFKMWKAALNAFLQDPKLTDDERFNVCAQIAETKECDPQLDWKIRQADYANALEQLVKDYPHKNEAYDRWLDFAAEDAETNMMRSIANQVLAAPVPDAMKEKAQAILRRLDAVGKPLDLKFTSIDGREVDLNQMKGKVVLVDFWATWCGPCVGEIPHVQEAYEKLHSKGFEVVGISFDHSKQALQNFIKEREMPWPEYFDGLQWQNKFGVQYAIEFIPTMWLVDKNGILCDAHARNDLQDRVEKLLAE